MKTCEETASVFQATGSPPIRKSAMERTEHQETKMERSTR